MTMVCLPQGNSAPIPRTDTTPAVPRNTNNTSSGSTSGGAGPRQTGGGQNLGNKTSSRSFHTASPYGAVNHNSGSLGHGASSFAGHGSGFPTASRIATNQDLNGSQSFNNRTSPQSYQTVRVNSWNGRSPLTSLSNEVNHGNRVNRLFSAPSLERGSAAMESDRAIVCSCGKDALLLTVRKEGPNTGKKMSECKLLYIKNSGSFLFCSYVFFS